MERGHQPKVKQGSPPKPRKVKAPKAALKSTSGSGKSAGPKKGGGTAKKSANFLGLTKSRPATGMSPLNLADHPGKKCEHVCLLILYLSCEAGGCGALRRSGCGRVISLLKACF